MSKIKPSCLPRIPNGISFCLSNSVWSSHTDVPVSFFISCRSFPPLLFFPVLDWQCDTSWASPNLRSSLHLSLDDQRNKVLTGTGLVESCWNHNREEKKGKGMLNFQLARQLLLANVHIYTKPEWYFMWKVNFSLEKETQMEVIFIWNTSMPSKKEIFPFMTPNTNNNCTQVWLL